MVYAKCNNEDCEKDSWWLKKPPGEYASGGPKCPDCGTTRVEIDNVSSDAESAAESEPETRPATAQDGGGEAQGGSLDTQQDAIQAGAQVGVSCPECSMQITDLPPKGTKFRCPGCGQLLESQ